MLHDHAGLAAGGPVDARDLDRIHLAAALGLALHGARDALEGGIPEGLLGGDLQLDAAGLVLLVLDRLGGLIASASNSLTVNYTGPVADPLGAVIISEILFGAVTPNAQFVTAECSRTITRTRQ